MAFGSLSNEEQELIKRYLGPEARIEESADGNCFILTEKGKYDYKQCFSERVDEWFEKRRYNSFTPTIIISVYGRYLCKDKEEGLWYCGRRDSNGNYEFDSATETLEQMIESL